MSIIIGTLLASKRFNELCNVFLAWFLQTWELIMILKVKLIMIMVLKVKKKKKLIMILKVKKE